MNLKNIEAGSKKVKKTVLFKEGKKTTGLIEKVNEVYINVFLFFESIVVNDIENVHNVSLFFIRTL